MLVAAAVCPHPPLLVPAVGGDPNGDLDACRLACDTAIEALLATDPDLLVVWGGGKQSRGHPSDARGSLAPYGVPCALGDGEGPTTLPLSLGIGRWLLASRALPDLVFREIAAQAPSAEAAALGAADAMRAERVAALVMADGSAYPLQTPVGDDGRGKRHDDRIADALEKVDPDDLLALDPADDAPLWTAGRPALQALAGAIRQSAGAWRGDVTWRGEPYGVGYLVASLVRT